MHRAKNRRRVWYLRSLDLNDFLNAAKARRAGEEPEVGASLEPGTLTGSRLTCLEEVVEGAVVFLMAAIAQERVVDRLRE